MAATKQCHADVDLGFAEKFEKGILATSLFNPSKSGGKPAWLNFASIPTAEELKCALCGGQNSFLCQIYVPTEIDSSQYHRVIYLFCCRNGSCSKQRSFIKAFRCQKYDNEDDFYDETESDTVLNEKLSILRNGVTLCSLCGCLGVKACSSCRKVFYCCKDHQIYDWKTDHKNKCTKKEGSLETKRRNNYLFDEHEIVIEQEYFDKKKEEQLQQDQEKYAEYIQGNSNDLTDQKLEKDLKKLEEQKVDENFMKFKERISLDSQQIIRYDLGGEPLWVAGENIPAETDIPNCKCGAKRQFEFQVLPQMLNYLGIETSVDSMDWGVLCVYTCIKNCDEGPGYKEEFVWKQDFSQTDVVR